MDNPCIRLQGKWLSNLGFHTGNNIKVSYSENQIIIEAYNPASIIK